MVPPKNSAGSRHGGEDLPRERGQELTTPTSLYSDLPRLQELLTADRAHTSERISALTRNVTSIVEAARYTATDDEHDPEGSTIAFERSQASALLAAATEHLADVDMALERIADGRYGRCERCGEPISRERLLARPMARTCIACAATTSAQRGFR